MGLQFAWSGYGDQPAVIDAWLEEISGDLHRHIFYLPAAELEGPSSENTAADALNWQKQVLGGALACTRHCFSGDHLAGCRVWMASRGAYGPEISIPGRRDSGGLRPQPSRRISGDSDHSG